MACELPTVEQPRFSLSEFEALAQSSFSPTVLGSDVFTFEPNEGLLLQQEMQLTDLQPAPSTDTLITFDDPMEFATGEFGLDDKELGLSIDIEAAQHVSPHASVSSNPTSPAMSEEDSGNASDESSTYDPSNAASMDASLDVELDLKVPRAQKRELQARPFAKRSKSNFYEDMTEEERRLIEREGFHFPNRALTKTEEKQLKKLRRKVKNKISAQDSRKRRKEYVSKLEGNIKQAASVNSTLKTRVTSLEKQNQSLLEQLRQLQAQLQRKIGGNATSAGTALMLLGLCFSMFVSPEAMNGTAAGASNLPSLETFTTASVSGATPSFTSRTLKSIPDVSSTSWMINRKSDGADSESDVHLEADFAAQLADLMATLNTDPLDLDDNATEFDDDRANRSTVPEPATFAAQDLTKHLLAAVDMASVQA